MTTFTWQVTSNGYSVAVFSSGCEREAQRYATRRHNRYPEEIIGVVKVADKPVVIREKWIAPFTA